MPLHRDIHWLGRQWAVTGHGLQLINQKQMGYYDIEVARLWEPGVIEAMQSKAWINRPDFDKAVEIARVRFGSGAQAETPPHIAAATPSPLDVPSPATPSLAVPPSVPTIEELLSRLKSRSAGLAQAEAPPAVEPPLAEAPKPAPVPPKPDAPKSGLPRLKPVKSEPFRSDAPAPQALKPEAPKSESPKAASPKSGFLKLRPVKSEPLQSEPPKPEPATVEPPKPEPPRPEPRASEPRQAALAEPVAAQPAAPSPMVQRVRAALQAPAARPKSEWPVFERKIAGSARFVRPWRARLTHWDGSLPGLPPRP